MWFQISSTRENRQRDIRVSRFELLEKLAANNYVLSDAEDNWGPLNFTLDSEDLCCWYK